MRLTCLFGILYVLVAWNFAWGSDDESRQRFRWAWELTIPAIGSCVDQQERCGISSTETDVLRKIVSSKQAYSSKSLVFISGQDHPGKFDLKDAVHRIAVTGSRVGDVIEINSDIIESVSLNDALALFVHELGHHHGIGDTSERPLDRLSAKVRLHFEKHTQTLNLGKGKDGFPFQVSFFHYALANTSSSLSLGSDALMPILWTSTGEGMRNLYEDFKGIPYCPFGAYIVRKLWIRSPRVTATRIEDNRAQISILAEVENYCELPDGKEQHFNRSRAVINLNFEKKNLSWALTDQSSFQFDDSHASVIGEPKITEWKSAPDVVKNGGTWTYEATIQSPYKLEDFCYLYFRGKEHSLLFNDSGFGKCNITSTGNNVYRVQGQMKFEDKIQSLEVLLDHVMVYSTEIGEVGGPLKLSPALRPKFRIESSNHPADPQVLSYGVEISGDKGVEKLGMREISWCQQYNFRIKMKNVYSYLAGFLKTRASWRGTSRTTPYNFDPTDRFIMGRNGYPLKLTQEGDVSVYTFLNYQIDQLALNPDEVTGLEFVELRIITRWLQEVVITFKPQELGLKYSGGVHPQCGF